MSKKGKRGSVEERSASPDEAHTSLKPKQIPNVGNYRTRRTIFEIVESRAATCGVVGAIVVGLLMILGEEVIAWWKTEPPFDIGKIIVSEFEPRVDERCNIVTRTEAGKGGPDDKEYPASTNVSTVPTPKYNVPNYESLLVRWDSVKELYGCEKGRAFIDTDLNIDVNIRSDNPRPAILRAVRVVRTEGAVCGGGGENGGPLFSGPITTSARIPIEMPSGRTVMETGPDWLEEEYAQWVGSVCIATWAKQFDLVDPIRIAAFDTVRFDLSLFHDGLPPPDFKGFRYDKPMVSDYSFDIRFLFENGEFVSEHLSVYSSDDENSRFDAYDPDFIDRPWPDTKVDIHDVVTRSLEPTEPIIWTTEMLFPDRSED